MSRGADSPSTERHKGNHASPGILLLPPLGVGDPGPQLLLHPLPPRSAGGPLALAGPPPDSRLPLICSSASQVPASPGRPVCSPPTHTSPLSPAPEAPPGLSPGTRAHGSSLDTGPRTPSPNFPGSPSLATNQALPPVLFRPISERKLSGVSGGSQAPGLQLPCPLCEAPSVPPPVVNMTP